MAQFLDPKLIPAAKEKLKSGKTKQETFEELLSEFDIEPKRLARTIRFLPTEEKRTKYRLLGTLTLILFLGIGVWEIFLLYQKEVNMNQFYILFVATLVVSYGMIKMNPVFFSAAGFFGAGRLLIIALNLFDGNFSIQNEFILVQLIASPIIFVLGFYLRTKLDSRYVTDTRADLLDTNGGITFPD